MTANGTHRPRHGGRPEAQPRPFTLEAMQGPPVLAVAWRRIPAILRDALAMVWRAAPGQAVATTVLQVGVAAMLGAQLLIARELLGELIVIKERGGDMSSLTTELALLIAAIVAGGLMTALIAHQQRLLSELVARQALREVIDVSSAVELQAFEDPVFHDQLERAKQAGLTRPMEIVATVTTLGTAFLTSVGVAVVLAAIEPLLLPLVIAAGVPVLIATFVNSRQAHRFEWALTPQSRERYYLLEVLTERDAAKELRAYDATPFLRARWDALTEVRLRELRAFLRRRLRVSLLGTSAGAVGMALALSSLAILLAADRLDVASAAAAGVAMQLLATRITAITVSLGRLVEASMFLEDFRTFLALGARHRERARTRRAAGRGGAATFAGVALDRVSFSYPGTARTVLDEVSLEVEPGEVVALVGENGSGKTTLVKLVCGLYRPDGGRVLWNGIDARGLDAHSLREDVTVLFQDFVQYHLTAAENIALGRIERGLDAPAIEEAARRAGAQAAVEALPAGYDTRLGRQFYGGHELSIGQWQRLALARAFFRDSGLLILDEPTASLDPRAEHELFTQMRRLAAGRSVLLISHRFSSVRSADRIYVLHQGSIVESGSHDELLAGGGHYAELFRLQSEAYLVKGARAG